MTFQNSSLAHPALRSAMATLTLAGVLGAGTLTACGGGSSDQASSAASTSAAAGTSLASGYKQAKWAAGMTVTYPSDCTMKVVATGLPNHVLPAYDLRPATGSYTTVVATTPDGLALTLQPDPGALNPVSLLFNICPTKAAGTTVSNMGTIGTMISGAALFNAYDGTGSPAMQQNVSYTFTDTAGKTQTAAFLDNCNGHYTPAQNGNVYHYHGVSGCVTAQVDTAGGPSHIIGVALDGFPIYGGRDIQGQVITTAQLDACNGITSATPEVPSGVYHYVLPEGVSSERSSMGCYSAAVSAQTVAQAQATGICTTGASGARRLLAAVRMPQRKSIPRAV
jgi:hypothetical protein